MDGGRTSSAAQIAVVSLVVLIPISAFAAVVALFWPMSAVRPMPLATAGAPFGLPAQALPPAYTTTTRIRPPPKGARTDLVTTDGNTLSIACGTCHTTRPANPENRSTADLDLFHQGLVIRHGGHACLSCHDQRDYGRLHLADGGAVGFNESMRLCAQCHGPQWRDYQRGAHGGMAGHWDPASGGRVRNACTQCHDPHAPLYPGTAPLPPPRDRFQTSRHAPVGTHHD